MKKFSTLCMASLLLFSTSVAQRLQFQGARAEAMGGTGIASTESVHSLFINPAGLGRDTVGFEVNLMVSAGFNPVLVDFAQWAIDNSAYFSDIDSLLARMEPIDNKRAPFAQYLGARVRIGGLAFAALADVEYIVGMAQGPLSPVLAVGARSDFYFMGGYGMSVGRGWRLGGTVQVIHRLSFKERILGVRDKEFYTVKEKMEGEGSELEKLGAASDVAESYLSIGSNLGVQKDLGKHWTLGASLLDAPVQPTLNLGGNWHADMGSREDFHGRYQVNADLRNIFLPGGSFYRSFKWGTALEGWIHNRPVGYVAVGLNDGYPTFGARAGYFVYVSYTWFTREMGTGAGYAPRSYHKIMLDISF